MLTRNENGRLKFDDLDFMMMLDDMASTCKTKSELKYLLNAIKDTVETFIDEAEDEWEQLNP